MDRESLQTRIGHELAELRSRFPQIGACHSALEEWTEDRENRFALRLDIRWPQHQTLVSGDAKDNPLDAVRAAFDAVRAQLQQGATQRD